MYRRRKAKKSDSISGQNRQQSGYRQKGETNFGGEVEEKGLFARTGIDLSSSTSEAARDPMSEVKEGKGKALSNESGGSVTDRDKDAGEEEEGKRKLGASSRTAMSEITKDVVGKAELEIEKAEKLTR